MATRTLLLTSESTLGPVFGTATALIGLGVGVVALVLLVAALVSISRSHLPGKQKFLWCVLVLVFHVIGPIAWFVIHGRSSR